MSVKVQSAGQRLSRFLANSRWYFVFVLLRAACSSSARSVACSGAVCACSCSRSPCCLVVVPGGEEIAGDPQALLAERLLFDHAFAVGGEVAEEVRPAELSLAGIQVVVAAPAVGADDPGEALAKQRPGFEGVASGGDSEDRGAGGQGAPERAVAAAGFQPVSSMLTTGDSAGLTSLEGADLARRSQDVGLGHECRRIRSGRYWPVPKLRSLGATIRGPG